MQHLTDTKHGPGTVVIACASLARYSEFWMCVEALQVPHGTRVINTRGADFVHGFNEGIRKMSGEWVFILGDDHTFNPNILMKLLDREVDLVMPVVPRRDSPFVPVLMHGPLSELMRRYSWLDLPITGLFQLPVGDSAGQAGAVIRKPVLDMLGDPWFRAGQLVPGRVNEDMDFIKRMHELGVKVWIDCDEVMGHIANVTVTPLRFNGRWFAGHQTPRGPVIWDEPEMVYKGHEDKIYNIRQVA